MTGNEYGGTEVCVACGDRETVPGKLSTRCSECLGRVSPE